MRRQLPLGSHREQAAYWGLECVGCIRRAAADPHPRTSEDFDLHQAVRAARIAWHHAERATTRQPRRRT